MRKTFIALCCPTLGTTSIQWAMTLKALAWPMNTPCVAYHVIDDVGNEAAEARNKCVEFVLGFESASRQVSHIFWLDDDVLVGPRALLRLLSHKVPIASGAYFSREEPSQPVIFPGQGCGTVPFVPEKVFEVWGTGLGLTLVETGVYRRMQAELDLGKDRYGSTRWHWTTKPEEGRIEDAALELWLSEDVSFFSNAGALGYKPLMDTSSMAFGWHFDRDTRIGYPRVQYEQWLKNEPIVWETPEGIVTWQR